MKISPTEPYPYSALGQPSSLPEKYGVDFFWAAGGLLWGVQRKKFPEDFLPSLTDGRLAKELAQMQNLDRPAVVLEGLGTWTDDGMLVDQKFHLGQLYGWMLSCWFEKNVPVFRVKSQRDFLHFVDRMEAWSLRDSHHSLSRRPRAKADMWGRRGNREFGVHLLQSFDGVGPAVAGAIYDHFGRVPLALDVTEEELMKVPGVGPGIVAKIKDGL